MGDGSYSRGFGLPPPLWKYERPMRTVQERNYSRSSPGYAWGCFLPRAAWSPDGRTMAIPFRGTVTPQRSSLYAVDVATRKVEEVYSGSGCIGHPAWTPDKALIFSHAGELWMVLQRKLLEKGRIGGIRRLAGYGGSLAEQIDISRDGKTVVVTGDQSSKGLWVVPVPPVSPAKQLISGDVALSSVDEMVDGRILVTKDDSTIWTTKGDSSDWQRLANVRGSAMSCGQFVVVRTDDGSLVRFSADGTGGRTLARGPAKTPTCSLKGDAVFYVTPDQPQQIMRVPIDGWQSRHHRKDSGRRAGDFENFSGWKFPGLRVL